MESSKIKAMRVATDANQVRIVVGGRASYAYLIEAQLNDSEDPNSGSAYKSGILIPKDCPKETLNIINQAIKDAVAIGMNKKWGGKRPAELKLPLKNGDLKYNEDAEKYEAYKGMLTMTAKKIESHGRPILRANGVTVAEPGIIESGDWCAFDINFYAFSNKSKGIAVALNAVTLIENGERFGGGPSEDSIANEADALYGAMVGGGTPKQDEAFDDLDLFGTEDSVDEDEDLFAGL